MRDKPVLIDQHQFVLKKLQETYNPNAAIAGGVLRDLYYGRPPADVDIFTYHSLSTGEHLTRWVEDTFPRILNLPSEAEYEYRTANQVYPEFTTISGFLEFHLGDWDYQITFVRDQSIPELVGKKFNFSINQTYYDGNELVFLPKFLETAQRKEIYIVKPIAKLHEQEVHSLKRKYESLKKKYPDFSLHKKHQELLTAHEVKIANINRPPQEAPQAVPPLDAVGINARLVQIDLEYRQAMVGNNQILLDRLNAEWNDLQNQRQQIRAQAARGGLLAGVPELGGGFNWAPDMQWQNVPPVAVPNPMPLAPGFEEAVRQFQAAAAPRPAARGIPRVPGAPPVPRAPRGRR